MRSPSPIVILIEAVRDGNVELVRHELAQGANPFQEGRYSPSPLEIAVEEDSQVLTRLLASCPPPAEAQWLRDRALNRALLAAAANDQVEIMRILLDCGASPDGDPEAAALASLPLHRAANSGCDNAVALLLERGASPTASDKMGDSALTYAIAAGHAKVAEVLLGAGMWAVEMGPYGPYCRGLTSPLLMLGQSGNPDYPALMQVLLSHGASLDGPNEEGDTPLMVAGQNGRVKMAKALVDAGARLDAPHPVTGLTALDRLRRGAWDSARQEILAYMEEAFLNQRVPSPLPLPKARL